MTTKVIVHVNEVDAGTVVLVESLTPDGSRDILNKIDQPTPVEGLTFEISSKANIVIGVID